ncbi:12778_t:CDS:2, partial [Racocetra fulgida]
MEENTIPKDHYKRIEENSIKLNIPTTYNIIIYRFDYEFLVNHNKRRNLDANSQYNLGDIYFFGKLNIPVDKEKGKELLILAAKNKNTKAIELCRKANINLDQTNWDDSVTLRNLQ